MRSVIVVHPDFEKQWPLAAGNLQGIWLRQDNGAELVRLDPGSEATVSEAVPHPSTVTRLVSLCVRAAASDIRAFCGLKEAAFALSGYDTKPKGELLEALNEAAVRVYSQPSEGFWGQSVAEFGLALTMNGLRRIPQHYRAMLTDQKLWDFEPEDGIGRPGARGHQYGDDPNFVGGTVRGKRVRIVGAGNIASRYASFVHMLGADVAAWDPFASEPSFHRAGARKEWYLDRLVRDADIFVPMLPLTEQTRGLVTAEYIRSLPKGCLVVLVTRASICDMEEIRRRVLADEISLAADVFDVEPLPLDDPLLGRHNVVHTPHIAGRTAEANRSWAEMLAEQFLPV